MTNQEKRKLIRKVKTRFRKYGAAVLSIYFFFISVFTPTPTLALTGGPSQPEVQSFEPIGTSDMVDVFSGDFVYNIPLLDVEGYPINLSHHSGITMDQEASWTGLGWNINVGTINRALRGIPDDFNGLEDGIRTETSMKPNRTVNLGTGFSGELFGWEALGFSADLGISINNYTGLGLSLGGGLNFSVLDGALGGGLGISSSSENGLSVSPSISFSAKVSEHGKTSESLGLSIGTSYSSRGGLKNLSINASVSQSTKGFATNKDGTMSNKVAKRSNSGGTSAAFAIGQQTYIPSVGLGMNSFAIAGRFKLGIEAWGFDGGISIDAGYSSQWIKDSDKDKTAPAYGYFNAQNGQADATALLDFNREKDGTVSNQTPALPLTNFTYDIFSVSGQGVGGSYRGFRGDIGYVFDPKGKSTSSSVDLSAEVSPGAYLHAGANIGVVVSTQKSGNWVDKNLALPHLRYETTNPYPEFENYYLREANEMSVTTDPSFMANVGGDKAAKFKLQKAGLFTTYLTNKLDVQGGPDQIYTQNHRTKREKRNSIVTTLTIGEVNAGMGFNDFPAGSFADDATPVNAPDHHIGEITSLGTDGMRYVYGLPAYNTLTQEVTFAVGQRSNGNSYSFNPDCSTGLIEYTSSGAEPDNSTKNTWGLDEYFQMKETPAYAHSFLLTAVVSPDYVDIDGIKGPSKGDLGTYTKFSYEPVQDYQWRTPYGTNMASYSEGLKGDFEDDRGNYVFGSKELWYLKKIETKNFVAIFHKEDRLDASSVMDKNGAPNHGKSMQALKKITLYSKPDYDANGVANATPLKEVHFEYDYSLCPDIPNNSGAPYDADGDGTATTAENEGGKLTLKRVYFTYRGSKRGKLSPYEFNYSNNYAYNLRGYNRWGNYKPNTGTAACALTDPLHNGDFPYVEQYDPQADNYASAWAITRIDLPSGGTVNVEYESDDYSHVQHRDALQMFKIKAVGNGSGGLQSGTVQSVSEETADKNRIIYFEVDPDFAAGGAVIDKYFENLNNVYFRALMEYDDGVRYDYVPGYAEVDTYGYDNINNLGWIKFKGVKLNGKDGVGDYNPMAMAGAQFGRMHLSRFVWDSPAFEENQTFGGQLLNDLVQVFFTNFADGFKNANKAILDKGRGKKLVIDKSYIRLNNVNEHKLGGGCRVKQITIGDEWDDMTSGQMTDYEYGQEYAYELPDGTSSGVASYEPQIGGDENPFRHAVTFLQANVLAPSERFYQEEPFGESFFPSGSVGYSRVVVRNLRRGVDADLSGDISDAERTVIRHATGRVEHEFYTSRDFPTITRMTEMEHNRGKDDPFSIGNLLNFANKDFFAASQGFVVELNDMHGKAKSQRVFQEDKIDPITSVEYFYQSDLKPQRVNGTEYPAINVNTTRRLNNNVTVVRENGTTGTEEIGVVFDAVADFRESTNKTLSPSLNINLDMFPIFGVPVPFFMPWPSFNKQETKYQSASFTKVINRFGILSETKAYDLGSEVSTRNLAYDAESGQVLLTQTATNFEDKIYTMNYPAYWYYESMGAAYKNIGFTEGISLFGGIATTGNANLYHEGDEVALVSGGSYQKAWVTAISGSSVKFELWDGTAPVDGPYISRIFRSGRRNMQDQTMASITTLSNPLNSISTNVYENIIQASAIEFDDRWRTYCDCFTDGSTGAPTTSNPYVLGTKGNWRPVVSYLHLSGRTQSDYNNNTNTRKDGMFETYTPYYKSVAGDWQIDQADWTYTAEVTEFTPFGQEVENRDALGRYSAATFGFNQTLAKSVAANARYRQIGFSSFEDDDFSDCADNHFKFDNGLTLRDNSVSHTGLHSIKVSPGNDGLLTRDIAWCDPEDCSLDITHERVGAFLNITPIGGASPYTLDWNLISGNMPSFNYDPVLEQLVVRVSTQFTMIITFIDTEGCKYSFQIDSQPGAPNYTVTPLN